MGSSASAATTLSRATPKVPDNAAQDALSEKLRAQRAAAERLAEQRVQTRINGQLVQDQPVSDMIWDIAFVIEYCSTFTTLEPGDVISMGAPPGFDKVCPKPGDRMKITIDGIGSIENPVAGES